MSKHYIFTYYIGGVCNFTCSYCHQNDTLLYGKNSDEVEDLRHKKAMSPDSYQNSIDVIQRFLEEGTVTVNLFGGETFLYKKQLIFILGALNNLIDSSKINVNISTNGSIYDEEILSYFSDCNFKSKKIDISWHITEHPQYVEKIKDFCTNLGNNFSDLSMSSTYVIYAGNIKKQTQIIKELLIISKSMGKLGITINFDISHYWSRDELGEVYILLQRIKNLGILRFCNIFFEKLECPELKKDLLNFFFLPQGDIFICPYIIIKKTDFHNYDSHRVGNFLEDSPEKILQKIQLKKKLHFFCETNQDAKKKCYFLSDSTHFLNSIIMKVFPE